MTNPEIVVTDEVDLATIGEDFPLVLPGPGQVASFPDTNAATGLESEVGAIQ